MPSGRFARGSAILAAAVTVASTVWLAARPGSASQGVEGSLPKVASLPSFDPAQPLTVVVRGWLWDPASRREPSKLVFFPEHLNALLQARYGLETTVYQYRWSRLPKDIPVAVRDFTAFARALTEQVARSGRCVNFVGHSAGAAIVYSAAASGVRMGYMGTLGLPTAGAQRPAAVTGWTNFYTTDTHDLAGILWGRGMGADRNVDTPEPHRELWSSRTVIDGSADAIAAAWSTCRP